MLLTGRNRCDEPVPSTVESESSLEMEWQFGTCRSCEQSISRFRRLRGGWWYDHWGDIEELAHLL